MTTDEIAFTIPDDITGVLRGFMDALRPLAGRRYREGPGVEVVLQEPAQEHPRVPGVVADIVLPACRVRAIPLPGDWGLIRDWRHEAEPRAPVMRFRFAILDGDTYVLARCDDHLPPAQADFLAALERVRTRYPAVGPPLQAYAAQLTERVKQDLQRGFGDADRATAGRGSGGAEERRGSGAEEGRATRLGGFRPAIQTPVSEPAAGTAAADGAGTGGRNRGGGRRGHTAGRNRGDGSHGNNPPRRVSP